MQRPVPQFKNQKKSESFLRLQYNYSHLHIPVCHLKMSVWEQDNGNNPAADFQIKF